MEVLCVYPSFLPEFLCTTAHSLTATLIEIEIPGQV